MNKIISRIINLFKSENVDFEWIKLHCVIVAQWEDVNTSYITSIRKCVNFKELREVIEKQLHIFRAYYKANPNTKILLPNGTYTKLYSNGKVDMQFTLKNGKFVGEDFKCGEDGLLRYKIVRDKKGRILHLETWSSEGELLSLVKYEYYRLFKRELIIHS